MDKFQFKSPSPLKIKSCFLLSARWVRGFFFLFCFIFFIHFYIEAGESLSSSSSFLFNEFQAFDYKRSESRKFSFLTNKPMVVVFLSAKCPCSASHMNHLTDLATNYKEFQFIGVHSNQDESLDVGQRFFSSSALPFAIIRDEGAKWANQLGALKTPHVFLLAKNREILFAGPVTDASEWSRAKIFYLKDSLESLRKGVPLPKITKRPLGCYIKR